MHAKMHAIGLFCVMRYVMKCAIVGGLGGEEIKMVNSNGDLLVGHKFSHTYHICIF